MPELKHNFIKGRMNLDMDERLVPDGEYRHAMNIEVDTSEGSNVGTVQPVLGNVQASFDVAPSGGFTVGSIVDSKTDNVYYLTACQKTGKITKDVIIELTNQSGATPVMVDVYKFEHTLQAGNLATVDYLTFSDQNDQNKNIRPGMRLVATFVFGPFTVTLTETSGTVTITSTGALHQNIGYVEVDYVVHSVPFNEFRVYTKNASNDSINGLIPVGTDIIFKSERILNFKQNNFITGINIVEDLLFWTDDRSEPKKINIQRSIQGTDASLNVHTKHIVIDSNGAIQSNKYITLRDATVAKPSPLTPPSLEMYSNIGGRGNVVGVTQPVNFSTKVLDDPGSPSTSTFKIVPFPSGTSVDIPFTIGTMPEFTVGDILLLSSDSDLLMQPEIFIESEIRVVVTGFTINPGTPDILHVKVLSFMSGFFPYADNGATPPLPTQEWAICLEQAKALFEFKFPRFAYRYKYQDGEYSSFSPFSEVAFLPGDFKYDSKEAYNLGMVNQLRFLKILDFVPDGLPGGVVEVDILYKESNSPNIYTVKTVKSTDPEWLVLGHQTPQTPWPSITKGGIQLESEMIYASVPSNQLLRPWDNVPVRARAQELSANRIIYANYVEGYDVNNNVSILTYVKSKDVSNYLTETSGAYIGTPSIKSLRTYQVGIVYKDKFGRETPVFTNEKASFNIAKGLADDSNNLFVHNNSLVPDWVDSYKFFIKETSNEYYNLALDRWYTAEDGGIWLSFPSAERNKVDEDTYLILKKQHDTDNFVSEKARYKIIAIENEAPDFIKMERTSLATSATDGTTITATSTEVTASGSSAPFSNTAVQKGKAGLVMRLFSNDDSSDWYRVKSFSDNALKIRGTFDRNITADVFGGITVGVDMELAQEVFHNRPEFEGRFFVKVAEDGALLNGIDTGTGDLTQNFTVKSNAKQFYMKSFGVDNSWSQKEMWYGYAGSWREKVGPAFFIDEIDRNWGTVPGGPGPWLGDSGRGINNNRSGVLNSHLELSLSEIKDSTEEGFSIAANPADQRKFYNLMHTKTTWVRWKEDPNGIVYEIVKSFGKGDSAYDSQHGSGIYNYDGGNGKERTWKSNKTRRLYITFKATEWRKDSSTGAYLEEPNMKGMEPTWISNDINTLLSTSTNFSASTSATGWNPTNNDSSGTFASIQQASLNGTNPPFSNPGASGVNVEDTAGFFNTIEIVQKYNPDLLKEMSENPAIFETEPKEDIGLDLYYEMDQAFPTEINGITNEQFAKIGSTVQTDFPGAYIETWKDLTPPSPWIATFVQGSNELTFTSNNLQNYIKIGDLIENSPGNLVPTYFPAVPVRTVVTSVSGSTVVLSQVALLDSVAGGMPVVFTRKSLPKIKSWDDNTVTLDCKVIGTISNSSNGFFADNVSLPIGMGLDYNSLVFNRLDGGTISGGIHDYPPPSVNLDGVNVNTSGLLTLIMRRDSSRAKIDLNWFNCYSFGNGVESNRVRDDYNAVTFGNGVKASTTLAMKYQEERKKNSLIYSGIYNNASGVNNTNQFIMAEKITKDLNPRHGSIQKLHAREGDLITLCEDKVFKILANKDALFNADGNPQLIATNRVLGTATPLGGEYGISKNPESFASQAYRAYFSDKSRGVILRLDGQGLVAISAHGMKDYFADELRVANKVIGSYDDKKDSYNITLNGETVSFGEKTNGWTSFKSFMQEGGVSLNNTYYTFKGGNIFAHHTGSVGVFYGARVDPYIDVLFNQQPGIVKSFASLNYEGSQSLVTQNLTDGEYNNNLAQLGWYVSQGNTDLQETSTLEFKSKEGKWFSRIKGEAYDKANIDLTEFSFQGIDMASGVEEYLSTGGCTDAAAVNFDPLATFDDGSCCFDYGCTDSQIGFNPAENGFDRFGSPCVFPCQDTSGNPTGFFMSNYDPKYDCDDGGCVDTLIVYGCTDPLAANYYAGANFDDNTCCYGGCMDIQANNYDATACLDDGSCTYVVVGPFNLSVSDLGDID